MSNNEISSEYEIDEDIRGLVEFCNSNGIKTLASCSGTIKDHKDLDGKGQLYIKDSELSRKIAAAIIDAGICETDLYSKPVEKRKLYDNTVSYPSINFSFVNSYNEVLPKIEDVIHKVVARELEPKAETMDKLNQVFDFFDSIDRKIDSRYIVKTSDFSGELNFFTDNISALKRVDKESVVETLVNATGNNRINDICRIGIEIGGTQDLQDILSKAKSAVKKAPNISRRKERIRDIARQRAEWENYRSNTEPSQTLCMTSQPLQELLGNETKTPDEIAITDSTEPDELSGTKDDIIIEPWDNL